jgi:hypothetical protein
MRRLAVTMLLLLGSGAAQSGLAGERGPACREPSVVDEIAREVRAGNYYGSVDPRWVSERPTADPRVVLCQVCVLSAPYDTARFGDHPVRQCLARGFEVRIVANGFVVRDLR